MKNIERLEKTCKFFTNIKEGWKEYLYDAYSDEIGSGGYSRRHYGSGCLKLYFVAGFIYVIIMAVIWLFTKDFERASELSLKISIPIFVFQFVGYFIVYIIEDLLKYIIRKKKQRRVDKH